jgi:16S rRNA (cytosine967-C5)-methyltransferase
MTAEVRARAATAREVALRVLDASLIDKVPPEPVFAQAAEAAGLSTRDRGFARLLYTTVLRRKAGIDRALGTHLREVPKQRSAMNLLRLGAAQLLYLKTAAHAGVGESVELAKRRRLAPPGLVNAVLRKLAGGEPPPLAPLETLPGWLGERWTATFGAELAARIAAASVEPAQLDLSVKDDPEAWAEKLGGQVVGPRTVRLAEAGPVEALAGFAEGAWWVQDLARRCRLPCFARPRASGCSISVRHRGARRRSSLVAGAAVTSVERDASRAERLRGNLRRLRLEANVVVADLLDFSPPEPFDAVLLDAPCTATGTIRRHPDIMWAKGPPTFDHGGAAAAAPGQGCAVRGARAGGWSTRSARSSRRRGQRWSSASWLRIPISPAHRSQKPRPGSHPQVWVIFAPIPPCWPKRAAWTASSSPASFTSQRVDHVAAPPGPGAPFRLRQDRPGRAR